MWHYLKYFALFAEAEAIDAEYVSQVNEISDIIYNIYDNVSGIYGVKKINNNVFLILPTKNWALCVLEAPVKKRSIVAFVNVLGKYG